MEKIIRAMMDLIASEVCGKSIDKSQYTLTDEELAKQLGLTDEELCSWQTQLKVTNVVSLNEFEENGPEPMIDSAHPVRFSQPEEVVEEAELKEKLSVTI